MDGGGFFLRVDVDEVPGPVEILFSRFSVIDDFSQEFTIKLHALRHVWTNFLQFYPVVVDTINRVMNFHSEVVKFVQIWVVFR